MTQKPSDYNRVKSHFNPLVYILFFILVATVTACKSNFPKQEFNEAPVFTKSSRFTLGPGDSISIRVYQHPDLSGSYNVDDVGRISLPLILGINTRGLTLSELEEKITIKLAKNFIVNPKVSIDLVRSRPFCILGEVRNPGCFSGIHGMNSAQAIAIAGGYTYRAFKEKFALTREDGRKVVADTSTPIFGGDTIEVYERYF